MPFSFLRARDFFHRCQPVCLTKAREGGENVQPAQRKGQEEELIRGGLVNFFEVSLASTPADRLGRQSCRQKILIQDVMLLLCLT